MTELRSPQPAPAATAGRRGGGRRRPGRRCPSRAAAGAALPMEQVPRSCTAARGATEVRATVGAAVAAAPPALAPPPRRGGGALPTASAPTTTAGSRSNDRRCGRPAGSEAVPSVRPRHRRPLGRSRAPSGSHTRLVTLVGHGEGRGAVVHGGVQGYVFDVRGPRTVPPSPLPSSPRCRPVGSAAWCSSPSCSASPG